MALEGVAVEMPWGVPHSRAWLQVEEQAAGTADERLERQSCPSHANVSGGDEECEGGKHRGSYSRQRCCIVSN